MTVEVRTVYTSELGLAANCQTAAAAHTRAVNHDGVHGNDGLDAVWLSRLADELHHNHRADGNDNVVLVAGFNQFLQRIGNKALVTVGTVIGYQRQSGSCRQSPWFI